MAHAGKPLQTLLDALERTTVVDAASDRVAAVIAKPLAVPWVRSLLSGTAAGHPAHPALVTVPMGSWLAASYLDLTGRSPAAARSLVGFGLATAAPAFLTGASDWSYTTGAERRVGAAHAAGNWLAAALYAGSWVTRRRSRSALPIALAAAGSATLAATGWLGGHLTYARGVGVDTTAFQVAPSDWVDVLAEDELQVGVPTLAHAGSVPVLLYRDEQRLHAIADRCSHRGGPLHEGVVTEGCVVCPWHQAEFWLSDGQVRTGPATRAQAVFEARTRYGKIQLRRTDEPGSLRASIVS